MKRYRMLALIVVVVAVALVLGSNAEAFSKFVNATVEGWLTIGTATNTSLQPGDVNMSGNLYVLTGNISQSQGYFHCFDAPVCDIYDTYNGTCILRVGPTSTLEVC